VYRFGDGGLGGFVPLGSITEEYYDKTFDTNVKGLLFTVQKALPFLNDGACGGLRSRPEEERPQDKGPTQDLWKKDKAEVFACECQINATGCQSGLWRA
jgi:hypothetical protein